MQGMSKETFYYAFAYVIPSYDWANRRLDAIERRIERSLILIPTLALGGTVTILELFPGESESQLLHFPAYLLLLGGWLCLIRAVRILYLAWKEGESNNGPNIILTSPDQLLPHLALPEDQFCKKALEIAGKHMRENREIVEAKYQRVNRSFKYLTVGIMAFGLWPVFALVDYPDLYQSLRRLLSLVEAAL